MISGRLSSQVESLKPRYDVVVVGSGYGGAILAARLAATKLTVCVLERGSELRPGDYPASLPAALRNVQVDLAHGRFLSPTALYDLRLSGDLNVLVGCGLGGTSLINANVMLRPEPSVFGRDAWPEAIREEARSGRLFGYFAEAGLVLDAASFPAWQELPRKYRALELLFGGREAPQDAGREGTPVTRANVAVLFPRNDRDTGFRPNKFGVLQHPCTGCGDCVSGCNYAAKNTVLMNYLPLAHSHGASIFTETKVTTVKPSGNDHWDVQFELLGVGRRRFTRTPELHVRARTVILAAGTLGSTEILLRSRDRVELAVSDRLGDRFSGNGDALAFAYNGRTAVNGIGAGRRSLHGVEAPGPCITGSALLAEDPAIRLQEGVIPGALSSILPLGFLLARLATGRRPVVDGRPRSFWRLLDDLRRGGVAATQTFLAMVNDPGYGTLRLVNDRVKVVWPGAGRGQGYDAFRRLVERACAGSEAAYVPSPFGPVTVHPLGGCAMADHAGAGVVDHIGRVFKRNGGVHEGLYVVDGSTIPCALVANPVLTIAALAERSAAFITGKRSR